MKQILVDLIDTLETAAFFAIIIGVISLRMVYYLV